MKTAPSLLVKPKCKYRNILIYIVAMFMDSVAQSEHMQIKDWMLKIVVMFLSSYFLIVNFMTVILLGF
jgi:hypothetical protein